MLQEKAKKKMATPTRPLALAHGSTIVYIVTKIKATATKVDGS